MSDQSENIKNGTGPHPDADLNARETTDKSTQEYKSQISKLEQALVKAEERASYLSADFENYRRRSEKDCQHMIMLHQTRLLRDIVSLIDDFDRALAQMQNKPELMPFLVGLELTHKALVKILTQYNVTEITQVSHFDPELHEAVAQVDASDKNSGDIVAVLQKGYMYKDSVLRPARVSVKA